MKNRTLVLLTLLIVSLGFQTTISAEVPAHHANGALPLKQPNKPTVANPPAAAASSVGASASDSSVAGVAPVPASDAHDPKFDQNTKPTNGTALQYVRNPTE